MLTNRKCATCKGRGSAVVDIICARLPWAIEAATLAKGNRKATAAAPTTKERLITTTTRRRTTIIRGRKENCS